VQWLRDLGFSSSIASDMANQIADDWRARTGAFPTFVQVVNSPEVGQTLSWFGQGLYALPSVFGVRSASGTIYYTNSPKQGLQQIRPGGMPGGALAGAPIYSEREIGQILEGFSSGIFDLGSGGGGGGGGGGRAEPPQVVLDEAQAVNSIEDLWRSLLFEDPPDAAGLAAEYEARANDFLLQGGRLDFETFVRDKIEGTARYQLIYGKKPAHMSAGQYIGQYLGTVRQLGLPPRMEEELAISGAKHGAGQAGFEERIRRGAYYQAQNQGEFSQKFAAMIAGLGIRGT
jgi:hypothetical protein